MALYRFVGTFAEFPLTGIRLTEYGQQIELTDEQARSAALSRCAIVPEEEFHSAGHTEDELKKFNLTALHPGAPAEFLAKREKAWELSRTFREGVAAAVAQNENKEA